MKKVLFIDLDDTLFQSMAKCNGALDVKPAAFLKDGTAWSFMTQKQHQFLELMSHDMTVIPTTARNKDALNRVNIHFSSYSIINYGGVILDPNGQLDIQWHNLMQVDMAKSLAGLEEICHLIDTYPATQGQIANARIIRDFDTPFYVVVKDREQSASRLDLLERDVVRPWTNSESGNGFTVHRNGNNLAILPSTLDKSHAVDHVKQRLEKEFGEILTFGMGDSKSDARFMSGCDYAIIPNATQLAKLTIGAL